MDKCTMYFFAIYVLSAFLRLHFLLSFHGIFIANSSGDYNYQVVFCLDWNICCRGKREEVDSVAVYIKSALILTGR